MKCKFHDQLQADMTDWIPSKEEIAEMKLMLELGKTYNEYYFMKYQPELEVLLSWVASAIMRINNGYGLMNVDKEKLIILRVKLRAKLKLLKSPRLKDGDLAFISTGEICTIVGTPRICNRRIVQDVLCNSTLIYIDCVRLKPVNRKKSVKVTPQVV